MVFNGLVVKALGSQSRRPVFETTKWLKATQSFILPRSIKCVPGISGNLVVKSKLPCRSRSVALRQLNPVLKKRP